MTFIKGIMFLLSSLGYWEFLRRKGKINVFFAPIITMAVQFCVLFVCGLLYILPEAAVFLYVLGICLLVHAVYADRGNFWKFYCNWGYVYFALVSVILFLHVKDAIFCRGDDFNHWATVMKKILETDRFPNFKDAVIGFQHYPLGSSVYIYYFCKLVGNTDGLQLFAQSFVMTAALLPLFAFAERQGMACIFMVVMTNLILGYNASINSLLVDTLLPLVGMSAVLYVIYLFEKEGGFQKKNSMAIWALLPLVNWTSQIKNSGILFSFFAAALMIGYLLKDKTRIIQKLIICCSPLFSFLLWDRHCTNSFSWAAQTKHAMTAMNYIRTFSEKSMDNMRYIVFGVIRYMVAREGIVWILIWLVLLGVIAFLAAKNRKKLYGCLVLGIGAMYVVYIPCLIGMYLLSMPLEEAMDLASIERYARTMDIAAYSLIMLYSLILISGICKKVWFGITAVGLIAVSVVFRLFLANTAVDDFTLEDRRLLENVIVEYEIEKYSACYICLPYDDSDYYKYLCGYLLDKWPETEEITDAQQLEHTKAYDVLINLDQNNPVIQQWISENYPDQMGASAIFLAEAAE